MDELSFVQIIEISGLRPDVCADLIDKGWKFVTGENEVTRWVAPEAGGGVRDYIPHEEPICDMSCGNKAPHLHGLPCYTRCVSCEGVCHPQCPAYIKPRLIRKENG